MWRLFLAQSPELCPELCERLLQRVGHVSCSLCRNERRCSFPHLFAFADDEGCLSHLITPLSITIQQFQMKVPGMALSGGRLEPAAAAAVWRMPCLPGTADFMCCRAGYAGFSSSSSSSFGFWAKEQIVECM
jgi:hypothetical protein